MASAPPLSIHVIKSKKTSTVDELNRHQRRFAIKHILDTYITLTLFALNNPLH